MAITSFNFFAFLLISVFVYYIVPIKVRWCTLLIYSVCFFVLSSNAHTGIYVLINILITTLCVTLIGKARNEDRDKKAKGYLLLGLFVNVGILAVLKYSNFFIRNVNNVFHVLGQDIQIAETNFAAPLGISFYTLISVGYLLDCYWGITEPQSNFFKNALFIGYYPQMTSGPITRYGEMKEQLYEGHTFSYKNIAFGSQRILWGVFKKLVVSSRVMLIVDAIYADPETYNGLYIWCAAFLFMLQLYTDFSGCMDIVLGASECYGIILPENFKTPFSSKSVQEYWQRWHATLGAWLKDYILYPILRTQAWRNLTKWLKKKVGKKASKQIPAYLGMLCVWLLIGLWHGGSWKYILGMGLWFWACIVLSQVLEPFFKKLKVVMGIDENTFGYHVFQSLRVFILVSIGNMFFRASSFSAVFRMLKEAFSKFNPWIFFDGSFIDFGVTYGDINIILLGTIALICVGRLQEKHGSARGWMRKQFLPFRWIVWLAMFIIVLIYGTYGPGYDASSFIYGGF